MITAIGDPTVPLPWIRCELGGLEDYDFICPDCNRPICYDHGEKVDDEELGEIWVCVECVSGIVFKVSEVRDEPLTIDSKTGQWVNLVTSDQDRNLDKEKRVLPEDVDTTQMYINLLQKLFGVD